MNVANIKNVQGCGTLVLVSFPHQILHALSALTYERIKTGISLNNHIFLFFWSHKIINHKISSDYIRVIKIILRNFSNITLIIPTFLERLFILSSYRSIKKRSLWIKKSINRCNFDTFFYSHDISADHTAQVLMQAFENTTKICFGDPPGFLYKHEQIRESYRSKGNLFRRLTNKYNMFDIKNIFFSSKSIVSINIEYELNFQNVECIPKNIILDIYSKMKIVDDEKHIFVENNLKKFVADKKSYILVFSNFSQSKLMNKNQEISFYVEIITHNIPAKSNVILKFHPGMYKKILPILEEKLPNYNLVMVPSLLRSIPIELMIDIVKDTQIISVSTATVLISYLSKNNVLHALDRTLIYKYFKKNCVNYVDVNNQKIIKTLKHLNEIEK